jgi:hypothetical protein
VVNVLCTGVMLPKNLEFLLTQPMEYDSVSKQILNHNEYHYAKHRCFSLSSM